MARIELRGLVKDYDGLRAVHGVDLTVEDGAFCVFVGPSGCGKSTLLRMIAGLEEITEGALLIDGARVNDLRASERGLAMVFQTYALYPHMTVRQNLAFGLENMRMPRAGIAARIAEAARMLQLEPFLDRRPGQLSGGQRQRVAIGRAVVREPRAFLFDEPLSNLDAALRVAMRGELAELHRRLGATTIYVTHDQTEAMTMADRIVVLRAGRVEQAGAPLDLYNRPANRFVAGFLGSPRMNFIPCEVAEAVSGGLVLRDAAGRRHLAAVDPSGLRAGAAVELGLRPEHVLVGAEGHPVAVEAVEQLGAECYLHCRAEGGLALTVHLPGQTGLRRGARARVAFRPEFAHVFRAEGGEALPRRRIGEAVGG